MRAVPWREVLDRAAHLRERLTHDLGPPIHRVYGVPRGGCAVAALVGVPVDSPDAADAIVDDLVQSGATRDSFAKSHPSLPFYALFDKPREDISDWLVFPWESSESESILDGAMRVLQFMEADSPKIRDAFVRAMQSVEWRTHLLLSLGPFA